MLNDKALAGNQACWRLIPNKKSVILKSLLSGYINNSKILKNNNKIAASKVTS